MRSWLGGTVLKMFVSSSVLMESWISMKLVTMETQKIMMDAHRVVRLNQAGNAMIKLDVQSSVGMAFKFLQMKPVMIQIS